MLIATSSSSCPIDMSLEMLGMNYIIDYILIYLFQLAECRLPGQESSHYDTEERVQRPLMEQVLTGCDEHRCLSAVV